MTDHTPGPWRIGLPGGPQGPFYCLVNSQGNVVAPQIVGTANARLIAAAPELLEALRWFVDDEPCRLDHEGYCQTHGVTKPCLNQAAGAVILKAEGRKS